MIDAVILAGGESQRMGGNDKGLVELSGRPLVAWVIEALKRQSRPVEHLMLSANQNLADYARYGYPVLRDVYPGQVGALAGVHAALLATPAEYLLAVPCDIPFLPHNLLENLYATLQRTQADVVFARAGNDPAYSAVCLMRHRVMDGVTERLASQEYRLGAWYAAVNALPVDFPPGSLSSLETEGDVADLAVRLAGVETIPLGGEWARLSGGSGEPDSVAAGRDVRAEGELRVGPEILPQLESGGVRSDALSLARAAGLLAAKRAAELYPLNQPTLLTLIELEFEVDRARGRVIARAHTETHGQGGGEMAALTAVSVALLTLYDLFKAVDRTLVLNGVRLTEKGGGTVLRWLAEDAEIRL